jgi:radical SAM superfamily enzyme YgiQ (UPF0313 family)
MNKYQFDAFNITLEKQGAQSFSKVSYPIRYGRFSEIQTPEYTFQLNRNGEIKYIQVRNSLWPHPNEWFKRTLSNDWIYYSTGGYNGVFSLLGEYYLPCLSYPSNTIISTYAFEQTALRGALAAWDDLVKEIKGFRKKAIPEELSVFLDRLIENHGPALERNAAKLHAAIDGQVTVLPPDTRHVDYNVIPIIIADGCLYNCGFCRIKSGRTFSPRTAQNIDHQIQKLKKIMGQDLFNYNAVFLGQHDALNANPAIIASAAQKSYEAFDFKKSFIRGTYLFLFGSVTSFLHAPDALFKTLNKLPFYTYINLGLESVDAETLAVLKKPVDPEAVYEAFMKMNETNRRYENVEITANFVMGDSLPDAHEAALCKLLGNGINRTYSKGAVYISPLEKNKKNREILNRFFKIKNYSRLPVFIYLIQRL